MAARSTPLTLNKRTLTEIAKTAKNTSWNFLHDAEGKHGEMNAVYIGFTPEAVPFAGQKHILCFRFTYGSNEVYSYPQHPPNVTFVTPIWHTNVGTTGAICLDVIKPEMWSPMYGVETIYNSIIALLCSPNTSSPMNGAAAKDWNGKTSEAAYAKISSEYYAKNDTRAKALLTAMGMA